MEVVDIDVEEVNPEDQDVIHASTSSHTEGSPERKQWDNTMDYLSSTCSNGSDASSDGEHTIGCSRRKRSRSAPPTPGPSNTEGRDDSGLQSRKRHKIILQLTSDDDSDESDMGHVDITVPCPKDAKAR